MPRNYIGKDSERRAMSMINSAFDNPNDTLPNHTGLGIPEEIRELATPSKMYEDGGRKLAATHKVMNRAMTVKIPVSAKMVYTYYNEFIEYCLEYQVPPTLSLFALWCGMNINTYNLKLSRHKDTELGMAMANVKESLRAFIELAAMQGDVDRLIYFHQQKGYYDVVEKVEIKHNVDVSSNEMSEEQIDAVIGALPPIEVEIEIEEDQTDE